jgi:3-oxoacyl-[acyl-carrier protein] reductase
MDKVVLITGSAKGIGASIAYAFASRGYTIILNDYFNYDRINEVEEKLNNTYHVPYTSYKADVSNENEVKDMVDDIIKKYGKIDVLVNNAAIVTDMPLMDRPLSVFEGTIKNNLTGTYIVSKYVSTFMLEKKMGKIINIASTNGIDCISPDSIDYDASKAGVISLTKNFAKYLAPFINVNAIAPGWVDTDMNKQLGEEIIKEETDKIYLKRFAKPEEIASLALFLGSDDASYVNGAIIKIDGGM